MQLRFPASVGVRVAIVFLILGAVALGGAVTTWFAMEAQASRMAELTRASTGPTLVEAMRAGVYAVVMESRGLYLPNPPKDALAFAKGLRQDLENVQADWRVLREVLPEEDRLQVPALEAALRDFVALRTELARVGVEEGATAADKIGNNDVNRATRKKFSDALDALAKSTPLHVSRLNAESIAAGQRLSRALLATTSVVVAFVMVLGLWLLRRTVSLPLRGLASGLVRMADGQLDGLILPPAGEGEVGAIAAAADVFLTKLRQNRELEANAAAERAAAIRRQSAMDRHTQDFGATVAGVMASLVRSAATMHQSAREMLEAARRTSDSASSTVDGATTSSRDLNSVAVAAEEMAASIGEISQQVAHVTEVVRVAVERASVTDSKVSGLAEVADRIGDVVRLITDIASQTNLLALNATIEAARAGEAGKGFAVVAGEVKALAGQTARATEQIGTQVMAIRNATGEAVASVRDVGAAIGQVEEVANAIAAAVEVQATATRAISATVQVVTVNTGTAVQAMRDLLTIAERTNTASQTVVNEADEVGRTAETLRVEVNDFLTGMARDDDSDRREYERIPGGDSQATVRIGGREIRANVQNISRGGIALSCDLHETPGSEVWVTLPGGGEAVHARVVHARNGSLALAFSQDAKSLATVRRAIGVIGLGDARAAA